MSARLVPDNMSLRFVWINVPRIVKYIRFLRGRIAPFLVVVRLIMAPVRGFRSAFWVVIRFTLVSFGGMWRINPDLGPIRMNPLVGADFFEASCPQGVGNERLSSA